MHEDKFARSSVARAWQEVRELSHQLETVLARLERIEHKPEARHLQRCKWCGEWALAPACREHFDLMTTADLLEESLRVS